MKRAALIYGLVLAVLLGFSWCEWTSETEVDRGDKVELLAGSAEDIVSIEWKGDKSESKLTRMSDAHGDYIWVDSTRWTKKPVVKPAAEDGEPVEVADAVDRTLASDDPETNAALWRDAGYDAAPGIAAMIEELAGWKLRRSGSREDAR